MKYERLTEYDEQEIVQYIDCKEYPNKSCYGECGSCGVQIKGKQRLAELEDKIENGTLVELPCKVGDVAWYVIHRGEYSTLCSTTVSRICIDSPNRMVIYLNATVRKIYIGYAQDDNAFLTKAEAEKRLKELRGER